MKGNSLRNVPSSPKILVWILLVVLIVAVSFAGAASAAGAQSNQTEAETHAGSHVEFETAANAIQNYSVDGRMVAESVTVQSQSEVRATDRVSAGTDVASITGFDPAAVAVESRSETSTRMTTESGASVSAHDNGHGSLVVSADDEAQYVAMNLSRSAEIIEDGEKRIVVSTPDESQASILVVGEGNVAVNENGNLTAELASDSRLVVRSYAEERSAGDREQEGLITSEHAAVQVYLTENGTDVVDYGQETTIDVTHDAEGSVEMAVDRSDSAGKVVLTTLNESEFDSGEDVEVRVDGESVPEASTIDELEAAADGGESSTYLVRSNGSVNGTTDVLVALNHFSVRTVTLDASQPSQAERETHSGAHTEFETSANAIENYRVDGRAVAESVSVQSQSEARARGGISMGTDISSVTGFPGAAVTVEASAGRSTRMTTDSGASMTAHDNGHGSLVVSAGDEAQYVAVNVSRSAEIVEDGEKRIVVNTPDDSQASVLVVGEGNVAVNDDGNVSAELEGDSHLVVRSYEGERSEDDRKQEGLITSEHAAVQVYLTDDGTDVVDYGQGATVDVTEEASGTVEMTVDRSEAEGKVVLATVSDDHFDSVEDIEVRVDGEVIAEASSYSDLEAAADGGESATYLVRSDGSVSGSADVLVALEHFSQRTVTMTDSDSTTEDGTTDDGTTDDGDEDTTDSSDGGGIGFTLVIAVLAILAIVAVAHRRSN